MPKMEGLTRHHWISMDSFQDRYLLWWKNHYWQEPSSVLALAIFLRMCIARVFHQEKWEVQQRIQNSTATQRGKQEIKLKRKTKNYRCRVKTEIQNRNWTGEQYHFPPTAASHRISKLTIKQGRPRRWEEYFILIDYIKTDSTFADWWRKTMRKVKKEWPL